MLTFIDDPFLFNLRSSWFSALGDFQLQPRHFGYYIMRLWILFKPSVFSSLPLTFLQRGKEGMLPHYCQVEVQVSHSASLLLGGGGNASWLLDLY